MRRPELLAPAGGPDAGYAALAYGADAVYLGLKRFSARAEAENFGLDELDGLTAWAHSLSPRRKVYVTVNTLVREAELPELLATASALRDLAVDAVIVQDLGVARLLRRHFPALELHASTQMAVHSRRGVEALARLGFRRVVAARELTLPELRDLCRQPDVEVECFVHGAVCYAYSGLCLFSSLALGRSANRGRCAYVCGGSFTPEGGRSCPVPGARDTGPSVGGGRSCPVPGARDTGPSVGGASSSLPFAMKDLALAGRLGELAKAGVASLKIEGRKKSALYVAAVTDLYRGLLDGTLPPGERARKEDDLRTIFSRPWTELYLDSPRQGGCGEPERVGHRGVRVGTVASVRGGRRTGTVLRFRTGRALEVHDGLQIEVPGLVRPFGFSIAELRVPGSPGRRFEVPAGTEVEVPLPADHPPIPAGAAVHCTSSQAVKRAFRWEKPRQGEHRNRRPVDVEVRVAPDAVDLRASTPPGLETRQHLGGSFDRAREPGSAEAGARAAFERLGQTPFSLGRLRVEDEGGLFVAASQWNRLRRAATDALEAELARAREGEVRGALAALAAETAARPRPPEPERWSLKIDRPDLVAAFDSEDWEAVAELVVALDGEGDPAAELPALAGRVGRDRLRLALPAVMRSWDEERLLPAIAELRAEGWARWELANLAHWGYLGPGEDGGRSSPLRGTRDTGPSLGGGRSGPLRGTRDTGPSLGGGLDLTSDWPLYALNAAAGNALLDLGLSGFTLSPEDGAENLQTLLAAFGARASVLVYQDPPLFLSETCPRATLAGGCPGPSRCDPEPLSLVSDFGDRVRVLSRRCRTIAVSRSPLCLSEALGELRGAGARSFRVDLQYSDLSPTQARDLWRRVRAGLPVPGSHLGNYRRGLL